MNSRPLPADPTEATTVSKAPANPNNAAALRRLAASVNALVDSYNAAVTMLNNIQTDLTAAQAAILAAQGDISDLEGAGYIGAAALAAWTGSQNLVTAGALTATSLAAISSASDTSLRVGDLMVYSDWGVTITVRALGNWTDGAIHIQTYDGVSAYTDRIVIGHDPSHGIEFTDDGGDVTFTHGLVNIGTISVQDSSGDLDVNAVLVANGYKSSDGTAGQTATTGGLTFKNGLCTAGTISAGLSDAPSDGSQYCRKDAAWVTITTSGITDAPSDGSTYGRKDAGWVAITTTGVTEPTSDGTWARKRAAGPTYTWEAVDTWTDPDEDASEAWVRIHDVSADPAWASLWDTLCDWTGDDTATGLDWAMHSLTLTTKLADAYIDSATDWNTAYSDRLNWDGNATSMPLDADKATARTSIGLGDSATKDVGTASGTVAAGNHLHTGVYSPVAGHASIATVGTVTTGTWSATTIAVAKGGTGLTALGTAHQVLGVNSGATALVYKTLSGTANQVVVGTSGNDFVLSLPQDVHTSATPQFTGVVADYVRPTVDKVWCVNKAGGLDAILQVDTTNNRLGIGALGAAPDYTLDVAGGVRIRKGDLSGDPIIQVSTTSGAVGIGIAQSDTYRLLVSGPTRFLRDDGAGDPAIDIDGTTGACGIGCASSGSYRLKIEGPVRIYDDGQTVTSLDIDNDGVVTPYRLVLPEYS